MEIAYFNGKFLPKDEIKISPDDRGFLFADGIYEVMKWYEGFFYDKESHLARMKRGLREIRINWPEEDTFPIFANELINRNRLSDSQALIYLQVTRGVAPRTHSFPDPEVNPTIYAFVKEFRSTGIVPGSGVKVMLKEDIRWSRCDIKSVALLANILSFQEAHEKGFNECIFVRNGMITEGSRSNIFFVIDGTLYTHPESEHILSGVTRKNILRIAKEAGITAKEEPLPEKKLGIIHEAFITNTSAEVTPVIAINKLTVGNGMPGPVTMLIHKSFNAGIIALKG
ncbi:MAG: aminotransferase class IV [Bacteroidales bacterium]|nr:aminotransferase class IV [Bacteroidales bacterium]MDP3003377.1 aminotransferase class IV [Bacteroidales bacterium]